MSINMGSHSKQEELEQLKLLLENGDGNEDVEGNTCDLVSKGEDHLDICDNNNPASYDFESALAILKLGRYQIYQLLLLSLTGLTGCLHMLSSVFISANPSHKCYKPDVSSTSNTSVTPFDHARTLTSSGACHINVSDDGVNNTTRVEKCTRFVYDNTTYGDTVVTEWDLVCDSHYIRTLTVSMYMAGVLVGSIIFGVMSDKYGRKFTMLVGISIQSVFGLLSAIAPTVTAFTLCRFLEGTAMSGIYTTAYVMTNEMSAASVRAYVGVIFHVPGMFGCMLLGCLAYFIRQWRTLQVVISVTGATQLVYYWVVDDSMRWLLSNGKHEQAEEIFKKAASTNNVTLPLHFSIKKTEAGSALVKSSVIDMLRMPGLRRNTLIIFYCWFVSSLLMYSIQLNIEGLPGDAYLNYELVILCDLPIYLFTLCGMSRVGRRPTMLSALLGSGVTCAALAALTSYSSPTTQPLITPVSLLGKISVGISFTTAYQFAVELFPTVTRNAGLGASSMCARVGGMLAPLIILMEDSSRLVSYCILAATALTAAILTHLLPETRGRSLPDTLQDGQRLNRQQVVTGD